jgi:acetyl-CoA acetyltransferase family protein
MPDAVIVAAVRSAIGKKKGALSAMRADELLARVLAALTARAKVDPKELDDVVAGCVTEIGEQGFNVARTAALMAGFPVEVTGTTVNRMCGSSQQALHFAAQAVLSGQMDAVVAAGVESMTRVPMGSDGAMGVPGVAPAIPLSPMFNDRYAFVPQHTSAEMIAKKWKISRRDCEEFSLESHLRAARAREAGRFKDEIVGLEVQTPDGQKLLFDSDEGIRPDTTLEKLAGLKCVTGEPDGVVTAGTSSQISDGTAALLVMSGERAKKLGVRPRARHHHGGGRRRSHDDAPRRHPGDAEGPSARGPQEGGHWPRGDQRGVRLGAARLVARARLEARPRQRQRRGYSARPPARLLGRAPHDDAAA